LLIVNIYIFIFLTINYLLELLQKDPRKRMDIKGALEHPWIQKYNSQSLNELRRNSKDSHSSNFKIYSSTEEEK
jgi:serine/threonine protein kinase